MDFKNELPSVESGPEQEKTIENTDGFKDAVSEGRLEEAENWLMTNQNRGDARWLDHRSSELFKAYREQGDYQSAKKMVELGKDERVIEDRKKKLEEESGLPFEQI